jgi:hypothetical protein
MLTAEKYSLWNITKDGEPYALKGASTVRGGGHAIPERVNGPYSTQRPDPPVEGGRPRSGDGHLLCPT